MSLAALIARLFEQIGKNMTLPIPETSELQDQKSSERSIHVTPARRPIWPICCG